MTVPNGLGREAGMAKQTPAESQGRGGVAEYVGRLIPSRRLPLAFTAAGGAALLLLILTIVGWARSPTERARREIDGLEEKISKERKARAGIRSELKKAARAKKEAESAKRTAEREVERLRAGAPSLKARVDGLQKSLKDAQEARSDAEGRAQAAERKAKAASTSLARDKGERGALESKIKALESQVGDLRGQLRQEKSRADAFQAKRVAEDKALEEARRKFESIVETALKIEDTEKRVEALKNFSREAGTQLAGTPYMQRLDSHIAREEKRLAGTRAKAAKKAKVKAEAIYSAARKRARLASDSEYAIEVLKGARDDLEGTLYLDKLDAEIRGREGDLKESEAKAVYADVMEKIKKSPKEYEQHVELLEDAKERVAGTRYEASVEKHLASRKKTLKNDIARDAYEKATKLVRDPVIEDRDKIKLLKEAVRRTEGTRYERNTKTHLQRLTEQYRSGEAASAALSEVIGALEALRGKAGGTEIEQEIAQILEKARKGILGK